MGIAFSEEELQRMHEEELQRISFPMRLNKFLLKGRCRYGILLSTDLEVLAIVDTKTKEEVEATEEQLYGYMKYINIIDKVRKLKEINIFEGNFVPQKCAIEFRCDILTDVMCVTEKEVVCDNTCNFFLLLHQNEHIVRGENKADALINTTRPVDISGNFKNLIVGWDSKTKNFTSRVNLHNLSTFSFQSDSYNVQNWKTNHVEVGGSCHIDAHDLLNLNMRNTVIGGWLSLASKEGKIDIKDITIYGSLQVDIDILDLSIENTMVRGDIVIYNKGITRAFRKNVTVKGTTVSTVYVQMGNLCLTLDSKSKVECLWLTIDGLTGVETFSLNIGIDLHTISVRITDADIADVLLEKPKFLELLKELSLHSKIVHLEIEEHENIEHITNWINKNGLTKCHAFSID